MPWKITAAVNCKEQNCTPSRRLNLVIKLGSQIDIENIDMPPQKKLKVSEPSAAESESGNNLPSGSSKVDSNQDGDWRPSNWSQRNGYALKNGLLCDVSFSVGQDANARKTFHAHRLILALASPVFEAMFYGQLAEKGDCVTITDITSEGFEALLKYIYSDKITFEGSVDSLFGLWIAADKYCIPRIKTDCEDHLSRIVLTRANVWSTLQAALFLDIKGVVDRCHSYLSSNTESAMISEDFTSVNLETVKDFLSMTMLRTSELSLLEALVKWGEAQKDNSLKKAIEPCLGLIRFGALSTAEFCQFLDNTKDVVNDKDALAILKHLTKPKSYPLPDWCSTKSWSRNANDEPDVLSRLEYNLLSLLPDNKRAPVSHRGDVSDDSSDTSSTDSTSSSSSDSSNSSLSNSPGQNRRTRRRHPAGDDHRYPMLPIYGDSSPFASDLD